MPEIGETEILDELKKLPNGKAPGPDGFVNEYIKAVIQINPKTIANLYNSCLYENNYPARRKIANLVLIHKSGRPPEYPSAYRPLCMLNTVGKIFERILVRRLNGFLDHSNALCESQYGFRKHR